MSSEIRRTSADDPGETATPTTASDNRAIHGMNPTMSRRELAAMPDYDGEVPPPLEGADPGNEDAGEPAETTGLGEGHHSADELRAWRARNAGGEREDAQGQQPKDQVPPLNPAASPDADITHPADTTPDASPDTSTDAPPWATALFSAFQDLQAKNQELEQKLDASEAKSEALASRVDELEVRHQQDQDQISEMAARLQAVETRREPATDGQTVDADKEAEPDGSTDITTPGEIPGVPDSADREQAEKSVVRERAASRDSRDERLAEDASERPDLKSAGGDGLSLAGAFGVVPSPLSLFMSIDSARRSYKEMGPDEQYAVNNVMDTIVNAFSTMPPGTAVAAITASIYGPALHDKARDIYHKIRRKD